MGYHLYFARWATFLSCADIRQRPDAWLTILAEPYAFIRVRDREARADCQCGELIDRVAASAPVRKLARCCAGGPRRRAPRTSSKKKGSETKARFWAVNEQTDVATDSAKTGRANSSTASIG